MHKIKDPSIAKEKFDYRLDIKNPISYDKWVEFIELNSNYFTWRENTDEGKQTLADIDKVAESFREGILEGHNKKRAYAEFNEKKGYFELYIDFVEKFGKISTTFQKSITKDHLRMLLDMANHLDAYLLSNGTEIIDERVIESLS